MAFDLSKVKRGRQARPARVFLYGQPGIGKSTFAAGAPSPLFICTEDGVDALDVASVRCTGYAQVLEVLQALAEQEHEHQTLVIDTASSLEPMVWAEVCKRENAQSIEKLSYGKGYTMAVDLWQQLLAAIDWLRTERGMHCIIIGHCADVQIAPPDADPFRQYQPDLHKKASALLFRWADAVLFAHLPTSIKSTDTGFGGKSTRGIATGERCVQVDGQPAWQAKNRFQLTGKLPLHWAALAEAAKLEPAGGAA